MHVDKPEAPDDDDRFDFGDVPPDRDSPGHRARVAAISARLKAWKDEAQADGKDQTASGS